jgi:hypothetical protein
MTKAKARENDIYILKVSNKTKALLQIINKLKNQQNLNKLGK